MAPCSEAESHSMRGVVYHVMYQDGDEENMDTREMLECLVSLTMPAGWSASLAGSLQHCVSTGAEATNGGSNTVMTSCA